MTRPPLTFQSLSVLYWLTLQPSQGHAVPEEICPAELQPSVHRELADAGLLVTDDRLGGLPVFGIERRRLMAARAAAGSYRQAAIQRHILDQLKKNPYALEVLGFMATVQIHGDDATEEEFIEAEQDLAAQGLVKGLDVGRDEPLNHPEITSEGKTALRSEYAPEDWLRLNRHGGPSTTYQGDVNTIHQSGSGAASLVNQSGQHNTAQVEQSIQSGHEGLAEALDQIEAALRLYAPEDAGQLSGQIELIREADRDEAKPGVLRLMIQGLSNGLGNALGQRSPELIEAALATIPAA